MQGRDSIAVGQGELAPPGMQQHPSPVVRNASGDQAHFVLHHLRVIMKCTCPTGQVNAPGRGTAKRVEADKDWNA